MTVNDVLASALLLAASSMSARSTMTYADDIRPILERRCVNCHRPGEVAPMAFTSYKRVRPWASAIGEAVLSRTMPPWHAEARNAHAFRNDRSLSKVEIDAIADWVRAGAPEGNAVAEHAPDALSDALKSGPWKLGKPDLILQVPGFPVPKTGPLPYSFLILPMHFDRDTWVRAAEFRIDHRAVVHHINAFVRSPESSYLAGFPENKIFVPTVAERGKRRAGERVFDRRELLLGFEPGYEPMPWLDGGAKLIKAGSDIVFEMHYNPNGTEVTDNSEFGIYFAKAAPSFRVLAIDTLRDLDLTIPAGDRNYLSKASMTLARPVRLLSIQPHMHFRGKSMAIRAVYPGGREEDLLNVPKYDFNWQTTYVFRDPFELPAGTKIESVAGYDNSVNNAFNPNPATTVRWGDQTSDEMHIAFLELVIEAGAEPDTLFQARPE
ncbi:MAG: thiol-disulfide isomerase [Acidobacteriota bacterium]|nr:thiol-disulfide isomerase [Acidobacteriota bacterium]